MDDGALTSRVAPWASEPARRRLSELETLLAGRSGPESVIETVTWSLEAHRRRFDAEGIVLYAGTNLMSPAAVRAHDVAVSSRPSMGWPGEKFQAGLDHLDVLEVLAPLLIAELMEGTFAEVRLQSATLANLAVYTALTEPGDTIAVLPEAAGGHTSHHRQGVPGVRGLRVVDLPYDAANFDLDYAALGGFLGRERPRLVVIGASLMLFPHDVAAVRAAADEAGATVLYDASHVAGPVATRTFQRPLIEGAHVLTFSTYKSFGGPPGGCVVTNDERIAREVSAVAYPGMLANYDIGRLGSLAITAAEFADGGADYVGDCLANAGALAHALHEQGFAVAAAARGFTRSHHVALDAGPFGGGALAAVRLAEAGIYLSGIGLPDQPPGEEMRGLRIGTQEVTRRGFTAADLRRVAVLTRRALIDGEPPATVRAEAVALRATVDARHRHP
ncbi:MAG: Glycine hydroxymethyltransferase [Streptosporangiaceae bacterium]|jgi:glycine hydroxymethyltransferase|nr:Glycine hydroxymethyltransferase [Streptosporangiaceae bacterium]